MNINDIFLKRKKRWGTINRLRDSEEQADGSLTPSRRIALISDDKSFRELYAQVKTGNPNSFPGITRLPLPWPQRALPSPRAPCPPRCRG